MATRPAIPAALERRLMIEAGHRCAIPTCRAPSPLEIDHITDWAKVREHEFDNMIVLCANCHGRKGDGRGQIDRKALRQYKANLAIINSRYGDLERRVLEYYADMRRSLTQQHPPEIVTNWLRSLVIFLPGMMRLLMTYLIRDGYVEIDSDDPEPFNVIIMPEDLRPSVTRESEMRSMAGGLTRKIDCYRLTRQGIDFLAAWSDARPIDGMTKND